MTEDGFRFWQWIPRNVVTMLLEYATQYKFANSCIVEAQSSPTDIAFQRKPIFLEIMRKRVDVADVRRKMLHTGFPLKAGNHLRRALEPSFSLEALRKREAERFQLGSTTIFFGVGWFHRQGLLMIRVTLGLHIKQSCSYLLWVCIND